MTFASLNAFLTMKPRRPILRAALLLGLAVFPVLAAPAEGQIHNWQTGAVIPGTEGITPGPGMSAAFMDLQCANLPYLNLTDANLTMSNLSYAWLMDSNLTGANLSGANLWTVSATGVTLTGADLTNAWIGRACLAGANLTGADLTGADFWSATLTNANLVGAILTNAEFGEANLASANLGGANLTGASFDETDLTGASLMGADLTGAEFWRATLTNANLAGANLTNAEFNEANLACANLAGAILTNADFGETDLTGASLMGADLTGAEFWEATFTDANLTDAVVRGACFDDITSRGFTKEQLYSTASYKAKDLGWITLVSDDMNGWDFSGQDLSGAFLAQSRMSNANLAEANLTAAILIGTDLTGASFQGADLSFADLRETTGFDRAGTITRNTILPDGTIEGLNLAAGETLTVLDISVPVTVQSSMTMAPGSTLRIVFLQDPNWNTSISFAPGVMPVLGGTLELALSIPGSLNGPDIDPGEVIGRWFTIFCWPAGMPDSIRFAAIDTRGLNWDVSRLYDAGMVRLFPSIGTAWSAASGNWADGNCWSAGVPTDDTDAVVTNGGVATIDQGDMRCSTLALGLSPGQSGSVNMMTGGRLDSSYVYVGFQGTGSFVQAGGEHWVDDDLHLGFMSGGRGTYELSDGSLTVWGDEYVGSGGEGAFTQSGGAHTVAGRLSVGSLDANGTYVLSGGNLVVPRISVGAGGTLTLSGGSLYGNDVDANLLTSVVSGGLIEITSGTWWLASLDSPDANAPTGIVRIDAGATLWVGDITQDAVYVSGTLILDSSLLSRAALLNAESLATEVVAPAPEPATLAMLALGGVALLRRRR